MTTSPSPALQSVDVPTVLRLGTWNVSHWVASRAAIISQEVPVDVLALQETHLAPFPLECAHSTCHNLGLRLHHGHPVPPTARQVFGRSCGVGFIARQGVALSPILPVGPAWRRLYALGRLHGVRVPPRPGLPSGLVLLSVYAPLQVRAQAVAREQFVAMLLEVVHTLDLQIPTFLLGDFNGALDPACDFLSESGQRRPVCPLLAQLLGPGGPLVDVHRALLGEAVPWTFRSFDSTGTLSASRIDLALASHSAMGLVQTASVLESVSDGGHSPVLLAVRVGGPVTLNWVRPRPRLPPVIFGFR